MQNQRIREDFTAPPRADNTAPARVGTAPYPPAGQGREPLHPPAVLGRNMMVRGEIHSDEDLTIDGQVQGTIHLPGHRLTVGPAGKVDIDIVNAHEVIVFGCLKGNLNAEGRVIIRKDAEVVGDIQTSGIVIEDGAYFKGGISIRQASAKAPD